MRRVKYLARPEPRPAAPRFSRACPACRRGALTLERPTMFDFLMLAGGLAFFLVAIGYGVLCERL
ncbi:hypothetical protein [Labrys wisconsinensis]|uniref:Potassium-transporting ATPase subunit F n=1 Tax=Labrys wisconsinensis TaxID=425677 RepID=A0ABU0J9J8_9HYPH|nr:hypothetical protein [Labrys wisconsinensis]MDQ0470952.1 hypothetical protein [Labrys wisconsinensis]